MTLQEILFQSLTVELLSAVAALVLMFLMLRFFDWLAGVKFSELLKTLYKEDPYALSIYLAARMLGVALIIGMVVV